MKWHKIVIVAVIVTVILAIPEILLRASRQHDFKFLSEQFLPVFDDVNKQFDDVFSYKNAFYSAGGSLPEYSLEYVGEDSDFLEKSIEFCNMFSASVMSGEYETFSLKHEHVIRIKNSSIYLNCWYSKDSNSLTASTNATTNCAMFETLKGTRKLTVVTKDFTEEQKEYAKTFQDKCSFELVFSYKMPW